MKITTRLYLHGEQHAPITDTHYRLRHFWKFVRFILVVRWKMLTTKRDLGRYPYFTVTVSGTWPQRVLTRATRLIRTAWARRDPRYSVAAYSAHRYLADMIEGGRWFDSYALEEVRYVWRRSSMPGVIDAMEAEYPRTGSRYNVLGGEDYTVMGRDRFNAVPDYIDTYVPYE